jgi:hypothetical protein
MIKNHLKNHPERRFSQTPSFITNIHTFFSFNKEAGDDFSKTGAPVRDRSKAKPLFGLHKKFDSFTFFRVNYFPLLFRWTD